MTPFAVGTTHGGKSCCACLWRGFSPTGFSPAKAIDRRLPVDWVPPDTAAFFGSPAGTASALDRGVSCTAGGKNDPIGVRCALGCCCCCSRSFDLPAATAACGLCVPLCDRPICDG